MKRANNNKNEERHVSSFLSDVCLFTLLRTISHVDPSLGDDVTKVGIYDDDGNPDTRLLHVYIKTWKDLIVWRNSPTIYKGIAVDR